MGVAGRRRLVAQPGGLTLRFALHRVLIVSLIHYLFFFVSAVALTDSFPPSARRKLHLYFFSFRSHKRAWTFAAADMCGVT